MKMEIKTLMLHHERSVGVSLYKPLFRSFCILNRGDWDIDIFNSFLQLERLKRDRNVYNL